MKAKSEQYYVSLGWGEVLHDGMFLSSLLDDHLYSKNVKVFVVSVMSHIEKI